MIHDTRYDTEYGKDREVLTCKQMFQRILIILPQGRGGKVICIYLSNNRYFVLSKNNDCKDI